MGQLLEELFDTELHEAVRFGDIEEVQEALKKQMSPNQIGLYRWAPVHEAAHNGELEILRLILQHDGNPNLPDALKSCTPLHYAAQEGHTDCLRLLIKSGGRVLAENNNGKTVYDLASAECKEMVQIQGGMESPNNLDEEDSVAHQEESTSSSKTGGWLAANSSVLDRVSVESSCSSNSSLGSEVDTTPALGYIELSFEYDSRKSSIRVRVWQVSDILLPPPHTSMINSIYVKSILIPDKKRESKRKTEEVKVHCSSLHLPSKKKEDTGLQYVFTPKTFKFSKPLEYSNITADAVSKKSIQFEVCVTQKYSRKSFLVSIYRMTLTLAVKRLVRQKFPLIPCNNRIIPSNMKVYSASRLSVSHSPGLYHSNPDMRSLSFLSLNSNSSGYPGSDSALHDVVVERKDNPNIPSVIINMPPGDDGTDTLYDVRSIDSGLSDLQCPVDTSVSIEDAEEVEGEEVFHIRPTLETHKSGREIASQYSNILSKNKEKQSNKQEPMGDTLKMRVHQHKGFYAVSEDKNLRTQRTDSPELIRVSRASYDIPQMPSQVAEICFSQEVSPASSRPGTPDWDDFDLQTDDVRLSLDLSADVSTAGACLPIPTSMSIPCKESSFNTYHKRHIPTKVPIAGEVFQLDNESTNTRSLTSKADHIRKGLTLGKGKSLAKKATCSSSTHGRVEKNPDAKSSYKVEENIQWMSEKKTLSTLTPASRIVFRKQEMGNLCESLSNETFVETEALLSCNETSRFQNHTIPMQVFISDDSDSDSSTKRVDSRSKWVFPQKTVG